MVAENAAELVDLSVDDGLEVGDLGSREERADGFASHAVDVVVHSRKTVAGPAEPVGKVAVLVPSTGTGVERLEIVGVVNM